MNTPLALLGGLTPGEFLRDYWQKKPLLIRAAIPDFTGLLSPNELAGLACEEDAQARLIKLSKNQWQVAQGPFDDDDFAKLPKRDWTLLVQNVNHYLPEAADLLAQFNFIPHARLDDLMVSYAPKGGGVGAHVDSYDVFLLQGLGERRWKISAQRDLTLIEGAPLKILKHFETEQEWVLQPGDMLYLPPQIAHWGVAESDDCMTYSIGFRAPGAQELAHEFMTYLQDSVRLSGLYTDPELALQAHPAEIGEAMVNQVSAMLQHIVWNKSNVADFLGKYLTEPKPHVVFTPNRKISKAEWVKRIAQKPLCLDLKSQLLFYENQFYLNGEVLAVSATLQAELRELADKRILNTPALQPNIHGVLGEVLYEAYLAGFVCFAHGGKP